MLSQITPAQQSSRLQLDLDEVNYLDTAGAVCILRFKTHFSSLGFTDVSIKPACPEHDAILKTTHTLLENAGPTPRPSPLPFIEQQGEKTTRAMAGAKEFITYIGEITWALFLSLRSPRSIGWKDTLSVAEKAGVNALPIVALISFIVGLVMAFQAAIPMRMFGAELYVANLIGISMVRELGPLMTAIVLTGRSASAFAAELGTMRINEEIDALAVMGIDPIRYLVVPRVIATAFITPLMAVFSNLMGMIGGAIVITSLGYPIISYYNQIADFVKWNDFAGGLIKCFVFGLLIAITGCIRGYQTQSGSSAVGESTTSAVVTGIILIAVCDAVFSIVYFYLGV